MGMEQLTKQQIVLVTLLVSFVTSIATGIVTVALMDQAPPGVSQTINQIVERTIEKVVSVPDTSNMTASVVTKETVVVKEDDLIISSVDKNKNSIVRIYTNNKNEESQQIFVGLGTLVSKEGLIVTGDVFADESGKYLVTLDNTKFYDVTVLPKKDSSKLYFLKVITDEKNPVTFTPITFSDSSKLKLGQSVVAWGGKIQNSVFTGIVSSLFTEALVNNDKGTSTASTTQEIAGISTNINTNDSLSGGPLLNLYGEVIGIRVSSNLSAQFDFMSANLIKQEVIGVSTL